MNGFSKMENKMNDDVMKLTLFMIEIIGKNKAKVISEDGADWDFVASLVWEQYTGFFHEYMINDAIDFIMEVAEFSNEK
jgi:hypothetical protein